MNSRQLVQEYKCNPLTICCIVLDQYCYVGEVILRCILTVDEMWICLWETESKHCSMEWKHSTLPFKKVFKMRSSAGKVMLNFFVDLQWLMLEHSSKHWHAARPAEQAIWTKCQGIVMQGVVLFAWQCPSIMPCTLLTASGNWTWRCSVFLHIVLLWIITFGPHREALIGCYLASDQ